MKVVKIESELQDTELKSYVCAMCALPFILPPNVVLACPECGNADPEDFIFETAEAEESSAV